MSGSGETEGSGGPATSDPVEVFVRSAALFGETIAALGDRDWERPTRPESWTCVTTTAWVVVGDAQIPRAVAGETVSPPAGVDVGILGPHPVATWRGTALAAIDALRRPGAVTARFRVEAGEMVVGDLVGQRVTDHLIRAWDIGEAVGRPVVIAPELAEWCLSFWSSHAAAVLAGGVLPDTPLEPPADADPVTRLLALTGRRA